MTDPLNTPVRRWLRSRSDRCSGCGCHLETQMHDALCPTRTEGKP